MDHRDTSVSALSTQLGKKRVTLYRYVGPQGQKVLASLNPSAWTATPHGHLLDVRICPLLRPTRSTRRLLRD